MKILLTLVSVLLVSIFASLPPAYGEEKQPAVGTGNSRDLREVCPSGRALYLHHKESPVGGEKGEEYTIEIISHPVHSTGSVFASLILNILDQKSGKLLTKFHMDYWVTGGAWAVSLIDTNDGGRRGEHPVAFLNSDFGDSDIGDTKFPYAMIIPNSHPEFAHLDWEKIPNDKIEYFTKEHVRPDFKMPGVWLFSKCLPKQEK